MRTEHPNDFYNFSGTAEMGARVREWKDRARYRLDAKDSISYRFGKFLLATVLSDPEAARFCREQKILMTKAESENIDSAGGWVVPEEVENVILGLREAYGVVRRNARLWPLRFGGNSNVPRRTTGATATWTSEGGSLVEGSPLYDSAVLSPKKLAILIKTSAELEEDAIASWGAFLADEIAWAFAKAEDDAAVAGDGTPTLGRVTGLQAGLIGKAGKITANSGHNTFATLDATDIGALVGAIPARAMPNAKIFVSMAGYGNTIVRLAGASGGLAATVDAQGNLSANYLGLPVEFVPSLPTSTGNISGKLLMFAGDMKQGIAIGERRQITIRRSAERFADVDQIAIIGTERVDINVHDIGDASNAGALVGLFAP
jgi:HK97 family phage major capsid protein